MSPTQCVALYLTICRLPCSVVVQLKVKHSTVHLRQWCSISLTRLQFSLLDNFRKLLRILTKSLTRASPHRPLASLRSTNMEPNTVSRQMDSSSDLAGEPRTAPTAPGPILAQVMKLTLRALRNQLGWIEAQLEVWAAQNFAQKDWQTQLEWFFDRRMTIPALRSRLAEIGATLLDRDPIPPCYSDDTLTELWLTLLSAEDSIGGLELQLDHWIAAQPEDARAFIMPTTNPLAIRGHINRREEPGGDEKRQTTGSYTNGTPAARGLMEVSAAHMEYAGPLDQRLNALRLR